MFKVMIVDDEPIIVEGLTKSIKWDTYECEIVATASNGIEGKALIQEKKPDIIFTDICMPEMDGLTMMAGIKSEFPDMELCVLTGFREFDYAQRAIRLGVSRFLLKPSNMSELEEAIVYMVDNVKKRGSQKVQKENDSIAESREESITEQETAESKLPVESAASSFIVKNALAYMEAHYQEKILLSDVADQTYVSQWHLSKLLNRHTGQNFSELLNTVRIEKAKEMLKEPELRIGEIAEAVGFLDMAHFSRVFKKITGVSANHYRNTILCNEEI
ncbi:MAG: response regulator [Lachnospiraceae bacterium]|nr:response regulator [Lachnospiraceae bacterium]